MKPTIDAISLKLEEDPSDHPRHLTIQSNHLIAIGGENGNISALPLLSHDDATSTTDAKTPKIIKRYDDPVKALAFSSNGQRVAVGYEDGSVDIYVYSQDEIDEAEKNGSHPFISKSNRSNDEDNLDDDDDDQFFTQSEDTDNNENPTFRLKFRFENSIRHLQFRPLSSGKQNEEKYYLAIAAESSPGFMIVDVTSEDSFVKYLEDEASSAYDQGGVRSVAFSPDGNMVMSLGMDGRVCFWSTKGEDPSMDWELINDGMKVVSKVDAGGFADVGDKSLYPVWSSCGNLIGFPGSNELKFRKRENSDEGMDWLKKNRMILNFAEKSSEGSDSSIVGLAFDPSNDGYAITSTRDGNIGLWRFDNYRQEDDPEGKYVKVIHKTESMCTYIKWHKDDQTNDETLYLALQNGKMITIQGRDNFIPKETKHVQQKKVQIQDAEVELEDDADVGLDTQPQQISKKSSDDDDFVGDEEVDNSNNDSVVASGGNPFVSDEADEKAMSDDDSQFDDVMPPQERPDTLLPSKNGSTADEGDDSVQRDDDDNANGFDIDDYHYNNNDLSIRNRTAPEVKPQPAFAPSSTPQATRTILCWNHVGVITSRDDDDYKSIDITFTDAMANRPVSFKDNMMFELGSLGEEGALFATDLLDDAEDDDENVRNLLDGIQGFSDTTKDVVKQSERKRGGRRGERSTGSCVYFQRFNTFGPVKNKDWVLTLPEGEKVLGCATGVGWNAVVTSRKFLRSFSSGGVQGPIIWMKGEPVTIVGRGRFLAVFYHERAPLVDGTQKLGYTVYDGTTMKEVACGAVAGISPKSSLTWAGFSSDFALSIMDGDGMLSMLMAMKPDNETGDHTSFSWVPMLDTIGLRKSREDSYWPVSVQNGKLICVPLKGVAHPNPARRPLTTSLLLRMPLVRNGNDSSFGLEEVAVRAHLALDHKNFVNEFNSNYDSVNAEDLEAEYDDMCAKVDKVTLKLLFKMIESGKPESALDLVSRLHLEESFEIAEKAADRSNHRKLSDRIYSIRKARFTEQDEESYNDDVMSVNEDVTPFSRDVEMEQRGAHVSPEVGNLSQKLSRDDELSEKPKRKKRRNPFATDIRKSPGKMLTKSPTPQKPKLSRLSSFSAESRKSIRAQKEYL